MFSLKNAARYELTKIRANSLVRRSASLECETSSSDFSRLVLAPHLVASYSLTPANLLSRYHSYFPDTTLNVRIPIVDLHDMCFCLSNHPRYNLESLRQTWKEIQHLDFEEKVHTGKVMRPVLDHVQRHGLPEVAREILRFVFYYSFPFNEII